MFHRLLRSARFSGLAAIVFVFATLLSPEATAVLSDTPVGLWKTIDDESGKAKSHVKIYERDGKLYGKVTKLLLRPGATCDKCEGKDKGKPIEGMVVMWGLSQNDDEWEGGKIFDPKKGKTYRCKIWLEDGGSKLKVRGYAGPFFRTQTWHRIK
jgi:uncharacterized protein (DUF2147 family)